MRPRMRGDFLGSSCRDYRSTTITAFETEIDDPVRGFYNVEIVFDDDNCIAVIAQSMQHAQKLLDIVKMQTGRGLVENVKGLPGVALGKLTSELDPLRLAA